jgi:polyhydroxyalkanoate synthesis regulator phasin
MTFLEKIQKKFGIESKKSIELTDASGAKITVETDAQTPAVGDKVTIDGQPAADGEYTMSDESKIVVKDGLISEIVPKADDAANKNDDTPAPDASQKSMNEMQKAFDVKLKAMDAKHTKEINALKETIDWLSDQVSSDYVPDEAEAQGTSNQKKKSNQKQNRTGFKTITK